MLMREITYVWLRTLSSSGGYIMKAQRLHQPLCAMNQNSQQPQVVFDSEEFQRTTAFSQKRAPGIIQGTIRFSGGLITNEKQAQYALIGFVVFASILVPILMFSGGGDTAKFKAPPNQKIIYPQDGPPRLEQNRSL